MLTFDSFYFFCKLMFMQNEKSKFQVLTFLNEENGGPGADAIRASFSVSVILCVFQRSLPDIFPLVQDKYPLSEQRRIIGISVRNYLDQSPGLVRLIKFAYDTVFITLGLFILSHRKLAQKDPALITGLFLASCILIQATRSFLYSIVLLFKEKGSPRVSSNANVIGEFIRPNIWCPPEPLWS